MSNNPPIGFFRRRVSEIAIAHRFLDPMTSIAVYYGLVRLLHWPWAASDAMMIILIFLLAVVIFDRFDLYRSWRGDSLLSESKKVIAAWFLVLSSLLLISRLTNTETAFPRGILLPFAVITPALLIFARIGIRVALRQLRRRGKNIRRVVIAGAGDLGKKLAQQLQDNTGYGIHIVSFFDDRFSEGLQTVGDVPVVGTLDILPVFVKQNAIDIVYMALPFRAEPRMRELVQNLHDTQAALYLVPDIFMFELIHTRMLDFGGIPVFSIFDTPFSGIDGLAKRLQDVVLASLILALISPAMLIIALLIKMTSKGPVLFMQKRYGLNGEEINVLKFRSMTVLEDGTIIRQATKNDPRVTKFGAFLRRTSLDELPQFINVLKGEMSIVGPRPHPGSYSEYYGNLIKGYTLRHRVKPGITGWAQINGWRGETETLEKMEKRIQFDLEYIRNWSVWFDLKIIFLTIIRGFRSENAY